MTRPAPLSLTPAAVMRIKALLAQANQPGLALRIGVGPSGCSGYSYTMELTQTKLPLDEEMETDGVRVIVADDALMYLIGTEVDFTTDSLGSSSFSFHNPNEVDRCGCGKSFSV